MFWMSFEDFVKNFNKIYVCRIYDDDTGEKWLGEVLQGEWTADTSGGCMNTSGWTRNPQYSLSVSQNTPMFITLAQPDVRAQGQQYYKDGIGFYILKHSSSKFKKLQLFDGEIINKTEFVAAREVSCEVTLEKGEYQHFLF